MNLKRIFQTLVLLLILNKSINATGYICCRKEGRTCWNEANGRHNDCLSAKIDLDLENFEEEFVSNLEKLLIAKGKKDLKVQLAIVMKILSEAYDKEFNGGDILSSSLAKQVNIYPFIQKSQKLMNEKKKLEILKEIWEKSFFEKWTQTVRKLNMQLIVFYKNQELKKNANKSKNDESKKTDKQMEKFLSEQSQKLNTSNLYKQWKKILNADNKEWIEYTSTLTTEELDFINYFKILEEKILNLNEELVNINLNKQYTIQDLDWKLNGLPQILINKLLLLTSLIDSEKNSPGLCPIECVRMSILGSTRDFSDINSNNSKKEFSEESTINNQKLARI